MFKKSVFFVLTIVLMIFGYTTYANYQYYKNLPSSYDPHIPIGKAFQTSKVPLLVEFYTDSCGSCQKLTPALHEIYNRKYKTRLTLVMLDMDNPDHMPIAKLFGVEELPALFVFDPSRMKKSQIAFESMATEATLTKAIDQALEVKRSQANLPTSTLSPKAS